MADTTDTTGATDAAGTNQTTAVAGTSPAASTTTGADAVTGGAAEAGAADGALEPTKASEVTLKDENDLEGDHTNQSFGNSPANPALPANLPETDKTVRLSRTTPDHPEGPVFCDVHPDMVGDYLRAGWNVDI